MLIKIGYYDVDGAVSKYGTDDKWWTNPEVYQILINTLYPSDVLDLKDMLTPIDMQG